MSRSELVDLLVIGGGPTGSLLATLVAERGGEVVVVSRPGPGHGLAEETLVPAAAGLLGRLGIDALIAKECFFAPPEHVAIWGSDQWKQRPSDEGQVSQGQVSQGQGFQVHRPTFDAALADRARDAGVRWIEGRAGSLESAAAPGAETVQITCDGNQSTVTARQIVIATGRTGPGNLCPHQVVNCGPETIALSSDTSDTPTIDGGNGIEAVPQGWFWWIQQRDGGMTLSLFCDGAELRDKGSAQLWKEAIASSVGPAARWTPPLKRGVIATTALRISKGSAWLAGDAASTVDPLSSQGVEKALASAERTALAVNAAAERPNEAAALSTHLQEWEAGLHRAHLRRTAEVYRSETRFVDAPFWRARRGTEETAATPPSSAASLQLSPELRRAATYRPRGQTLIAIDGYALGDAPPLDRIGPIPIGDLVEAARAGGSVAEIVERAGQRPALQGWRREEVTRAVELMVERRWLIR